MKLLLHEQLKILRRRKGFDQAHVADELEISTGTIQRIESGATSPRVDTLEKMSEILGFNLVLRIETD